VTSDLISENVIDVRSRLIAPLSAGRGKIGETISDWAIWSVVERSAKEIGVGRFRAHDLRGTCAKLCCKAGGDLEQIKFLLGHSSIQTTERDLGSEQEIVVAVNDISGYEVMVCSFRAGFTGFATGYRDKETDRSPYRLGLPFTSLRIQEQKMIVVVGAC